jgi:4-amino-4-deoxy-L-arabinose transferase-like glycosyltransferase
VTVVAVPEQTAGWTQRRAELLRTLRSAPLLGALGSVAVAVLLYTRFGLHGSLNRDEAIYVYGGQQLVHGTPPYVSIFDPKTPGATMLCGLASAVARLFGRDSLMSIRMAFFLCSVLTVLAIYLLVLQLWNSVVGGIAAAITFASFKGFAHDALAGPDAKTPGVLFIVVAMWLSARRRWFSAAVLASLAFLVWQPFIVFPIGAVVAAVLGTPEHRWRALGVSVAGAVLPVLAAVVYFVSVGAFGKFVEATVTFPLTGVRRANETVGHRIGRIAGVVYHYYDFSGVLFWIGLGLLVLLAAALVVRASGARRVALCDPLIIVVFVTFLGETAYALSDFQSYPDLFPLLPYPAIGLGGAVAVGVRGLRRQSSALRVFTAAVLAAALVLTVCSAFWFSDARSNEHGLDAERATACAVQHIIVPGTPLYALGDPVPLALTHRRNPDRFVFLESGVAVWKIKHTKGGFDGWTSQIAASRPSVVVHRGWGGYLHDLMGSWLVSAGYLRGYIGKWRVFMTLAARERMNVKGIRLTSFPTDWPQTAGGGRLTLRKCENS